MVSLLDHSVNTPDQHMSYCCSSCPSLREHPDPHEPGLQGEATGEQLVLPRQATPVSCSASVSTGPSDHLGPTSGHWLLVRKGMWPEESTWAVLALHAWVIVSLLLSRYSLGLFVTVVFFCSGWCKQEHAVGHEVMPFHWPQWGLGFTLSF